MLYDKAYFAGKVAAVTGAASGIGLALCEELLESGAAKVVLADFNRDDLAKHEARLSAGYPGRVKGVFADVTAPDDVKRMVEEAAAFGGGRLDLLINCAGAALVGMFAEAGDGRKPSHPIFQKTMTNEDWKSGFALNFFGPLYGCRHALPVMLAQGGGQIVNIISGIAFSPMAYQSVYAATKAALNALTLTLRAEYAHYGVKFNSATPGTTATPMLLAAGLSPGDAQSPRESARRILNGVANDDRLILGDDADLDGAEHSFLPDAYADLLDKIYLAFARNRRGGVNTFTVGELSPADKAGLDTIRDLVETPFASLAEAGRRIKDYLGRRAADQVPEDYFAGKTAVVTGGASGIGLALCEELLHCGAIKVVLADYNCDNLDAQAKRLNGLYPGRVLGVFINVADEAQVRSMIDSAAEFFDGPFDLLINCAGIGQSGLFAETPDLAEITARSHMAVEPPERWDQVFSVNFYGALYGCRAALPIMQKQGHGQIVNIISGTAFSGMPFQSIYASAKAALNALTLVLRYEYWDDGIRFNSATPGTTATAIFAGGDIPANAQTPEQSARRVLTGVARNERLILGDDDDAVGAWLWGNARAARDMDKYFGGVARSVCAGAQVDYGKVEP